jgi:hypothetical protein
LDPGAFIGRRVAVLRAAWADCCDVLAFEPAPVVGWGVRARKSGNGLETLGPVFQIRFTKPATILPGKPAQGLYLEFRSTSNLESEFSGAASWNESTARLLALNDDAALEPAEGGKLRFRGVAVRIGHGRLLTEAQYLSCLEAGRRGDADMRQHPFGHLPENYAEPLD